MSMSEDTGIEDVRLDIDAEETTNPVLNDNERIPASKHTRFSVFDKSEMDDPFVVQNGYSWDFILVVEYDEEKKAEEVDLEKIGYSVPEKTMGNVFEHQHQKNVEEIVKRVIAAGLDVQTQMARDKKHMIIKLRASLTRLAQHASAIEYKVLLDADKLKLFETREVKVEGTKDEFKTELKYGEEAEKLVKTVKSHYGHNEISWNEIPNDKFTLCPLIDEYFTYNIFTYDYMYHEYDKEFASLYKCVDGRHFPWRSADRIKLIESILRFRQEEDIRFEPYILDNGKFNPKGGEILNKYKEKMDASGLETSGCAFALRAMKGYDSFYYYTETITDIHGDRKKIDMSPVCYVEAYFPVHNEEMKEELWNEWIASYTQLNIYHDTLGAIREYFGEKIGLYFTFLNHYIQALVIPSFFGIIAFGIVKSTNTWENAYVAFYAISVSLWGIVYLELWKRREKYTALSWGMIGFEESEQNRPEYDDIVEDYPLTPSPITGEMEQIVNPLSIDFALAISFTVVSVFIAIVIGTVTGILLLRYESNQGTAASFLNAIQIQIFDFIYSDLAVWLTDRECARTDTKYEDSLIAKLFVFKFINSFSSMAFLAFAVPNENIYNSDSYKLNTGSELCANLKKCSTPNYCQSNMGTLSTIYTESRYNCFALMQMRSLEYNLLIIYLTGMFVGNFTEVVLPWAQRRFAIYREEKSRQLKEASGEEVEPKMECLLSDQFEMEVYDEIMGTLQDYAELAVQYGYTTLFAIAFPLTPLFALLSAILEVKVDGGKLLLNYQRPVAKSCEDIGTWQSVYFIITVLSVLSNLGIMAFRTPLFEEGGTVPAVWTFIICQYAIFIAMYAVMALFPDTPADVEKQLLRGEYVIKCLKGLEEDEAADLRIPLTKDAENKVEKATKFKIDTILAGNADL